MENFNDDLFAAIKSGEIAADSKITVDVFGGPIGGYGFRSGDWRVTIGEVKFKMFSSISHNLSLQEQEKHLIETVRDRVEKAIIGETYINKYSGNRELKYASQMHRI